MEPDGGEVRSFSAPALIASHLPFLTCPLPHGTMMPARESPSGKASAFQADIRGFESRLPLLFVAGHCQTGIGLVAQRLAQATHNRLVAGSNPAGPTPSLARPSSRGWYSKPAEPTPSLARPSSRGWYSKPAEPTPSLARPSSRGWYSEPAGPTPSLARPSSRGWYSNPAGLTGSKIEISPRPTNVPSTRSVR
jgi:hypothetical protein